MKENIIKLRKEGKSVNEIIKDLGCARSTVSYHFNNAGIGSVKIDSKLIGDINEYYLTHTKKETAIKFNIGESTVTKYTKNKRVIDSDEVRKQKAVISVVKRRQKIKEMAIEYKGGCCQKCGYNKCNSALEFHHLDPNEKDFLVSDKGHCRSWEKVKIELDKCILVCANCHREIHDENRKK